jgi:spore coat polysaccharide biosynthesis protein SpsF (cytidylyltransferase family)
LSKFQEAKNDPAVLVAFLEECEEAYTRGRGKLFVEGNLVEQAAKHSGWLGRYDELRAELEALKKFYEGRGKRKRAELYRKFLEDYPRALQPRDIEQFINSNEDWQKIDDVYQEISLIHDKMKSLVEQMQAKGWQISHITKLITSGLEDAIV